MQTVIHYAQSSGQSEVWTIDPKDDQDIEEKQIKDEIDTTSDQTIIESIRRIDDTVFGEGDEWDVVGISRTPGTITIEAKDSITHMTHTYTIIP